MIIQVIIRLVLYVDQWVLRTDMQYGLIDGQLTFITKIVSHFTFTFWMAITANYAYFYSFNWIKFG